jgi:NitT/TauT family transport system substrate-binding protein
MPLKEIIVIVTRGRSALFAALAVLSCLGTLARGETDQVRLRLQYGFIYLPIEIARSEGFIEKRAQELGAGKITVTLRRFSGTPAMNDALLSGNIDFGALGLPGLLIVWEKTRGRLAIKGLASMPLNAFYLYTNRPAIKSLADFTDQDRIAVPAPNSGQGIMLEMAVEKLFGPGQYARADRLMVSLPHPDATTALLAGGTIAGYFSVPPYSQILARDGRVHLVVTSKEILGGFEASGAGLGGSQRFVDANPLVSRAVLMGLDDAIGMWKENPRRAAEIYLASEPAKLSVDDVIEILRDGSTVPQVAPQGMMALAGFMAKTGMLKTPPESWKEVFFPLVHDLDGN